MFRDRWECGHIGTVIFAVQAVLLVPYIIIAVMGGGTTLAAVSGGRVPYWLGGAIVSLVVMGYVFFGGMRGTAWVNTFQTILFLMFGAVAVTVIGAGMGGFRAAMESLLSSPSTAPLADARTDFAAVLLQLHVHPAVVDRVSAHRHLLPHRRGASGTSRRPSCSIRSACSPIWLPSVFLGVAANAAKDVPRDRVEARCSRETRRHQLSTSDPANSENAENRAASPENLARPRRSIGRRCDPAAGGRLRAAVAGVAARRVRDGRGDGERLADSSRCPRCSPKTCSRSTAARPGSAKPSRWRPDGCSSSLITLVAYVIALAGAAVDLRRGDAVRVCRLFGALAAAGGGALLAAEHEVGRVRVDGVDGAGRDGGRVDSADDPAAFRSRHSCVLTIGGIDVVTRAAQGALVLGFPPVVPMTIISALLMIVVRA